MLMDLEDTVLDPAAEVLGIVGMMVVLVSVNIVPDIGSFGLDTYSKENHHYLLEAPSARVGCDLHTEIHKVRRISRNTVSNDPRI